MSLQEFPIKTDDKLIRSAINAIRTVSQEFTESYGQAQERDAGTEVVSELDELFQERLEEHLKRDFPNSQILGEETADKNAVYSVSENTLEWIIDPIDGTINYLMGSLPVAISIGIEKDGELYGGVISLPLEDKIYYTSAYCEQTFCNENSVTVDDEDDFSRLVINAETRYECITEYPGYARVLTDLSKDVRQVRSSRCTVADFAYVTEGRLHGGYTLKACPWDVAAGVAIIRGANGTITTPTGSTTWQDLKQGSVVYSNGPNHKTLLEYMKSD